MHPIVLAHGFAAFRRCLIWRHYRGVAAALREAGWVVAQPVTHPTESIEIRARQLMEFIEEELGPERPYHIIGHSMGGLDARWLASPGGLNQGDRIISVTTLGTPHRGSALAERFPAWLARSIAWGAWIGGLMPFDSESRAFLHQVGQGRLNGMRQLTPQYLCEVFNPTATDHPSVRYFSFAGVALPGDLIFPRSLSWRSLYLIEGENDALVSVESAQWGEFLGCIRAEHDELTGMQLIPWIQRRRFDHLRFFLNYAEFLREIE